MCGIFDEEDIENECDACQQCIECDMQNSYADFLDEDEYE